jgi:hypothetical protein
MNHTSAFDKAAAKYAIVAGIQRLPSIELHHGSAQFLHGLVKIPNRNA